MSLRPRYSLLTLLLLTAGIAVGIKLWRGPHRVVMNRPLTASDEKLIASRDTFVGFLNEEWRSLEYESIQGPSGPQIRFLLARYSQETAYAFIHDDAGKPVRRIELHSPSELCLKYKCSPPEHIVTLIDFNEATKAKSEEDFSMSEFLANIKNFYLVSSHRRLYRIAGMAHVAVPVIEVQLHDVSVEWQRDVLESELARVPSALQAPCFVKPIVVAIESANEIVWWANSELEFQQLLEKNTTKE